MPQKGPWNLSRNARLYGPERTLTSDVTSLGHARANWNIAKSQSWGVKTQGHC